jgi:uncharacterized membrane protein
MSVKSFFFGVIKRYFVSGVLVVVPLILTFLVLRFLFEAIDGILRPALEHFLGFYPMGLGLLTTLLIIMLAGLLTRNLVGAKLHTWSERLLVRMPLVRPIYSASKQLLEAVTHTDTHAFDEVALIEYPRKGVYSLCFVTQRLNLEVNGSNRPFVACFVASTPTPITGMVVMIPENEVHLLAMTVEEGIKFVVSGGVASPKLLKQRTAGAGAGSPEVTHEAG